MTAADRPCAPARYAEPRTVRAVPEPYRHRSAVDPLVRLVLEDRGKRLRAYRCTRRARHWAEDRLASGHAEPYFLRPIHTDDPAARLARAEPVQQRLGYREGS